MKCLKCLHENPDDAKFCNGCGQKLESVCVKCGKANPPGSKFCNEFIKPFQIWEGSWCLFVVTVGRPTLFQAVTEWGTPWLPASKKREEEWRGEASPVRN